MQPMGATGRHLYVMQAASGRIKIGRSNDPKVRRKALETARGERLLLLKVLKERGPDERVILDKLVRWRQHGEWFINTEASRAAIDEGIGEKIKFRFWEDEELNPSIADERSRAETHQAFCELAAQIRATP